MNPLSTQNEKKKKKRIEIEREIIIKIKILLPFVAGITTTADTVNLFGIA